MSKYAKPLRGEPAVSCRHCLAEIEAIGMVDSLLYIQGCRPYVWRHFDTGELKCEPDPPAAQPYDAWDATRKIAAGERRDYDPEELL